MNGKENAIKKIRLMRKEAEKTHETKIEELRKNSSFDELYRKINSLKWDFIRERNAEKREKIEKEIASGENEIKRITASLGSDIDVFGLPYACEKCNDTGIADGKICECAEKLRIAESVKENPLILPCASGLSKIDFSYYGKGEPTKRKEAKYLEKGLLEGYKIFLLAGKTGTGKTYFAGSIVRGMLESGKEIKALSAIKLNKILLEYHLAPLDGKKGIYEELTETDVMLIDDLGAEQVLNNVTIPYLLELLTERAENKKITLVTTNLSPTELEKRYGQRIVSRLLDKKLSLALLFTGDDLRITRK